MIRNRTISRPPNEQAHRGVRTSLHNQGPRVAIRAEARAVQAGDSDLPVERIGSSVVLHVHYARLNGGHPPCGEVSGEAELMNHHIHLRVLRAMWLTYLKDRT